MGNGMSDLDDCALSKYAEASMFTADWRVRREQELLLNKTEIGM